jgi:cyclohexadienyl dehydratase
MLRSMLVALLALAPVVSASETSLADLLGERLGLMEAVAVHKWHHGIAVEDLEREWRVLLAARDRALEIGANPAGVEALFRVQIEAAKDIQRFWMQHWEEHGAPAPGADLDTVIRPRLIDLGDAIVAELASLMNRPVDTLEADIGALEIAGLTERRKWELADAIQGIEFFDNRLAQVVETGVLRVGTTGDYAPFSYSADGVHFSGIDIDLAQDLAAALGVRVRFVQTSWPTLLEDLAANRWDIGMSGISRTEERARLGSYSSSYFVGGKTPIARCERAAEFDSLKKIDRPGVRVIVNPGGTNEGFLDGHVINATKIVHPDNRTVFLALMDGDADLMITDRIEVMLKTREHPELCATMTSTLNVQEKAYLMPQDESLRAAVDEWLTAKLAEGMVEGLVQKHLNP